MSDAAKSRILFVHNKLSSFVRLDRDLLAERYAVREWALRGRGFNPVSLARAVAASDLVFGWFASWHTLFPVLAANRLGKPSVLVVGGYDSANLPEIGYGSMRGGLRKWVSGTAMRQASALVPFSEASRREVLENVGVPSERVTRMYLGVPDTGITPALHKSLVLTIGNVDRVNLERKGLLPFVRAAALVPEASFVLAGKWYDDAGEMLKQSAAPNVELTGWVDDGRLSAYLTRAKVYVQASRHEGFGMAVAEAMLAGCVPVVTRAGSLPEIVGNTGYYAESVEPDTLASAIRAALAAEAAQGMRARDRILQEFPMAKRRAALYALVDKLLARPIPGHP